MRRTYQSASKDVHNFSSEFRFLLKLRDEGLLEVCNEESSPLCGYSQEQIAQIKLRGENPSPLDDEPNDEFEEDDDVNGNDAGDDVDESDEDDEAHEEQ